MTKRRALQILMLSPIYFRMSLAERKELVDEFCKSHAVLQGVLK